MGEGVFVFGPRGRMTKIEGARGETPPCPDARFQRGDVVTVSRGRACAHMPSQLVVLVAIPPGFSPDDARADLLGKPRPMMKRVGVRAITYLLVADAESGDTFLLREKHLLRKVGAVDIGDVAEAGGASNG